MVLQKKWIFVFLIVALLFVWVAKPSSYLEQAKSNFTPALQWKTTDLEKTQEKVRKILAQDFFYLANGAQFFAFRSQDGKYVLKFFKTKHLMGKKWLYFLPDPFFKEYRFRKGLRRVLRKERLFLSCKQAYENIKKETGLVFIHLNKTKGFCKKNNFYDKKGKKFSVDLNQYEFILQKKAILLTEKLSSLLKAEKWQEAKKAIDRLVLHIEDCCEKGWKDQDKGVFHNYGFIKDLPVLIDVGGLVQDESAKESTYCHKERQRVLAKIKNWVQKNYPAFLERL